MSLVPSLAHSCVEDVEAWKFPVRAHGWAIFTRVQQHMALYRGVLAFVELGL